MGRDLWRAIGAGQIRFKDLNEQDKKKVLEYGIQTKQINTNTLTNRAWQLLKQSPDFALSKVRESTAESLSIESTPQRTDYLSKARDVVKNIFTQPTTRTTVRPPVIEGTKYQLLNMNDLKKTGGAITVRTPDGKEKSQFTNVVIDGKEVPSYVAYAMMKAGRKIDSVLANPQRVTTVLDRGFIQVNPTTFVNRFTGELIMSDKPAYDYDTGEATLRAPTTTERIKTGLSEAEQKAKRAAEQLAQGISKGVLLPEIMSAVGPKTPEGERMYKPEDFTRPSETWLEQTAESVGGVLPYVMAGPVAGAAEAGLAKAIPALTKNIAGQILSRAAGRAALGVAVKGAQTAGKALLDTDYLNETSVRNILSELTDDALIMASFGAASKAVGEPLGVALSKALPKAFEPGLRGLATRAGIIGTRGFVSGAIGAVPSEAIKILKDPDKFDIKESSLNVLSTGIRFAVMDLAMGLKPNPPMFRLSWKVGTNNKVIAKPVVDFTQSIDVKKGYVSAGNGVWIKQTQDKGGIINREIVMQLTIDKDGILRPMASSAKETSEGMLSLPEKAAAKEKATITQRAAIEEKASKAAAQIVPKGTKPLKFNRVQSSYIKDGKTIEASGLQYKDYTIFDPKYGKRIVAKDGQIIAEADSFQEAKSIVADILEREPEDKQIKVGKSSKAKTERGTTVDVSFAVVNADDLITSHDTSLKVNPNYPQELQPRDRSRIASEFQIEKIAKNIEPEFLGESPKVSEGASIVGNDMIVESGNARVIALNRAYDYGTAKNYKQWLLDSAEQFGLNKDEIARMEKPVLVRIRQSDVDRVKFAQEANESSVATMSATEQAMTDAQKLDSSLLSQFYPTDDGNILNAQNRDFISRFLDKVVGPAEKGNYITKDGSISQEGIRRIQNAIFAKAYGDTSSIEKLAESTDSNIKNITNSMLAVAPRFVELKEAIRKGNLYDLDITSDISQAATKISSLRETGMKVEVYLRQTSLLEEDISDLAKDLLDIFDRYKRSSKKITSILQAYADAVETLGHPEQAGLFATTEVNKAEVLDAVLRRIEEGEGEQTSFFQDETRGGREDTSDTERKSERGEAQKPAETTGERLDKPKTKDKGDADILEREPEDKQIKVGKSSKAKEYTRKQFNQDVLNNLIKSEKFINAMKNKANDMQDLKVTAESITKDFITNKIIELVDSGQKMTEDFSKYYNNKEFMDTVFEMAYNDIKGDIEQKSPTAKIADFVQEKLSSNTKFSSDELFKAASEAYGGTMAENKFTVKDAYDAMELGINQWLLENKKSVGPLVNSATAKRNLESIEEVMSLIPSQTKRTEEQEEFQQFSTPPNIAYVASWVANITKNDVVLEPSAGVGGLAVFAKTAGADVVVNELSQRRAEVLKELGFDKVFTENAEQINNILPKDIRPTVVLINPPFSATAGRMEGARSTKFARAHIEQALKRLEPNGRLVAIVGRGMADNAYLFKKWWEDIKKEYNVIANIGIDGKNYKKYGTTFDIQLVVIDKTGPTPTNATITSRFDNLQDILSVLESVKHGRYAIPERSKISKPTPSEQIIERVPEKGESIARPEQDIPTATSALGLDRPGDRDARPSEQTGNIRPDTFSGVNDERYKSKERHDVLDSERRPGHGDAVDTARRPEETKDTDRGSGIPDRHALQRTEVPESTREVSGRLEIESKKTEQEYTTKDLGDNIYTSYNPQKLKIKGAKEHPGKLSESAAMSAVEPPDVTYKPSLPKSIIEKGKLSSAQLEAIVYAGQAHEQVLPNGYRKGFFIGDGTGVGKGREISGIILDNMNQGRKKAVWISESIDLIKDAKRDFKDTGGDPKLIFILNKVNYGTKIKQKEGIVYLTYNTLTGKARKVEETRLDQLVEWLGEDFDGVIALDESHNMQNAMEQKGRMGTKKPSQKALAGIELQRLFPNARVVYVSATGATEVSNLAYLDRLGLWGEGTSFANKEDFINKISSSGLAGMEMVARDMKAMGVYVSRILSYDGVTYDTLEHQLTPEQTEIYDTIAEGWQIVLQNMTKALEITLMKNEPKKRANAYAQFWAAQQRFYNQLLTSMQMPSVIESIRKDLKEGRAVILQLVNTNEATQNRRLAEMQEDQLLEELDFSPKDILLQYLDASFPVQQYEDYMDEDGNRKSRPVYDSQGNPVINQEALEIKEQLMAKIGAIKIPEGPLDMIINTFGADKVAEVTGRSRRIVTKVDEETGRERKVIERRSPRHRESDVDAFMNDRKQILVFTKAGGTGRSFHADRRAKNQRKRVHYLLQPGWIATQAVQGFGRSHRSNQVIEPHYTLVTTNLKGQKRFISTIARRLAQLGALTKGQRQAGAQGLFSEKDNLENDIARDSLTQFYQVLAKSQDISFFEKTGLEKLIDKDGNLIQTQDLRDISLFLNRILSLKSSEQNKYFDQFYSIFEVNVEKAVAEGNVDLGMENYRADKIRVLDEKTVYTDPSGAETKYLKLNASHKNEIITYNDLIKNYKVTDLYRNARSKKVYAIRPGGHRTLDSGRVVKEYILQGQIKNRFQIINEEQLNRTYDDGRRYWEKILSKDHEKVWNEEVEKTPKYREETLHLITGTILPIWNRLPEGRTRVIRFVTDDGRMYLGRLISDKAIEPVLKKLGVETEKADLKPAEIVNRIQDYNYTAHLANGWRIVRRRVSGEDRIEIIGDDLYTFKDELTKHGVFAERIQWDTRFFIPTGEKAAEVLNNVIKYRPIVDLEPPARTSRSLDDIVESNVKDVYEDLKGKSKQLGIMAKAFRANTDRKAEKAVNDSVEQVLESTGVGEKLPLYLRIALGIKEGVEDVFIFEPKLRDFPRFRNEVRLFKGVPKDAREFAAKSVYGIVGNLPKEDFEVFRKIIALRDIVENGTQGLRLPLDIPLEEYQEALDYYEEYAKNNSDLQKALDKHKELMESIAYDLVERGKLDEGSVREYYYPHRILGWERLYDAKGMPIRIRTPARRYTKQRTGSAKLIEMDYVDVVLQHITRVYIDNAIDDFVEKQAKEYDMMKEVKKDKKLYNELFGSKGPQPNQIYEIDGERYVAWQYNPGNAFYNALTITEKAILDAIAEDKSVAELVEDKQIKKALAVGRKHKMYLLPEPIAEKLSSFRKPKEYNAIYKLATEGITQWKRMVLGFAGLPYHLNNIIGDALNLYREDPVAFTKFFESISALRGSEKHKELVKLAKQHRVIDSGFFSTFSSIVDGKIAKQLGLSPGIIGKYEQASTFRENILRLAKFMKDMERIQSGKQVVTKSVEIKGLTPEEAAGKIAREALVDYQAISERMQSLRQFMFPFATFYVENTKSWFKYVTKNPKDMFLKFIIPAILMYIWNVIIQKDVEDELPDYFKDQFHINTGYRKVNGDPIIISFETPIDLAAKMIGLDKLPESITDILSGKKLPKEVGIEQLKYSILAPGRETFQLLNPLVKSGIEIAMNKNVFIGSTIVPARLKGTPEESKIKTNYFIQNVLSPYGHYVRVTRDVPPTGDETLFEFLFKGPLDFKRALGIREIDSEKIRINKIYEAKEKAETKYNQYRNEFEKAVISYSVEGDIEILRKAVDKLQDKGFGVTRDDFNKALEKPRVQREIVMKLLRKTRDKAERERLEAVLKDINRRSLEESLKTTPVKTRKDIIDEAGVELRKLFK